ncbi:hypothetical protein V8D89_013272, partial [Ganoderma adspersum]
GDLVESRSLLLQSTLQHHPLQLSASHATTTSDHQPNEGPVFPAGCAWLLVLDTATPTSESSCSSSPALPPNRHLCLRMGPLSPECHFVLSDPHRSISRHAHGSTPAAGLHLRSALEILGDPTFSWHFPVPHPSALTYAVGRARQRVPTSVCPFISHLARIYIRLPCAYRACPKLRFARKKAPPRFGKLPLQLLGHLPSAYLRLWLQAFFDFLFALSALAPHSDRHSHAPSDRAESAPGSIRAYSLGTSLGSRRYRALSPVLTHLSRKTSTMWT